MTVQSLAAWTEGGVVMLVIPQLGPGSVHVVCRQLGRVEGQLPRWMNRGPSQSTHHLVHYKNEGIVLIIRKILTCNMYHDTIKTKDF